MLTPLDLSAPHTQLNAASPRTKAAASHSPLQIDSSPEQRSVTKTSRRVYCDRGYQTTFRVNKWSLRWFLCGLALHTAFSWHCMLLPKTICHRRYHSSSTPHELRATMPSELIAELKDKDAGRVRRADTYDTYMATMTVVANSVSSMRSAVFRPCSSPGCWHF